jgi:hypothetical protein
MRVSYSEPPLQAALDLKVDKIVHLFGAVVVFVPFFICKGYADQVVFSVVKFANDTASFISYERQHESYCGSLQHSVREVVVLVHLKFRTSF